VIARIALIAGGIAAWLGIGVVLLALSSEPAADRIAAEANATLAASGSRLALAAEQTVSARLPEAESLAGVLALGKGLEPQDAKRKNSPPKENVTALASRTQAAISTLAGAPLYAIVNASGAVVAATLWPEETVVRAEPGVASALAGVSRLSVWRKEGQAFMLAAVPALGSDGTPAGALVVARPFGKELCDEIAQASGLKLFALSLAHDKLTCSGSPEAAALPALKPGDHTIATQAVESAPWFVDPARIGMLAEAWPFRSELPGSSLIAGEDLRPAFSALHAEQTHAALTHLVLLVPLAIFAAIALLVLGQSAVRMANHLSMVLQQGDKAGLLDDHHYNGRMRRLAKNVNGLLLRAPVKAPNDKISLMLGTVDEPPEDEPRATAAAPVPFESPRAPLDNTRAAAAFDDEFQPTQLGAPLPVITPITAPPKTVEPQRPAAALFESAPDSMLRSKSLGESRSLASEAFRFDDPPAAPPPALPSLPEEPPLQVPNKPRPAEGDISDSEADAALGALPTWSPEEPAPKNTASSLSDLVLAPDAPAPSELSPWNTLPAEDADPDTTHFQETYEQFVRTRTQCGESGELQLGKFIEKLKKSREQVMQKQNCQKVRFQVYVKDGKAALKAVAFR
jgi:hypothetical protein